MPTTTELQSVFARALPYDRYVATGKPGEVINWNAFRARCTLTPAQRDLVGTFSRRMPVLCISGTWCGDCVQQCPMFDAIAQANTQHIDLRFVDRDAESGFSGNLKICGGGRVPVVLFMNELHEFVSLAGDRTLARYRAVASRQLGASCPLPGAPVPADEIAATLQDWLNEFERVALLLRLSTKLRQLHAD
jgi:thiol-disulfide isomerase/thioredoxin